MKDISKAASALSKQRKNIVGGFKDPLVRKKAAETRMKRNNLKKRKERFKKLRIEEIEKEVEDLEP